VRQLRRQALQVRQRPELLPVRLARLPSVLQLQVLPEQLQRRQLPAWAHPAPAPERQNSLPTTKCPLPAHSTTFF